MIIQYKPALFPFRLLFPSRFCRHELNEHILFNLCLFFTPFHSFSLKCKSIQLFLALFSSLQPFLSRPLTRPVSPFFPTRHRFSSSPSFILCICAIFQMSPNALQHNFSYFASIVYAIGRYNKIIVLKIFSTQSKHRVSYHRLNKTTTTLPTVFSKCRFVQ